MNYKLHYDKLIERAKSRKLQGYKESHHIVPKCMNGTDDKDNLVNLTAREHFIAHILLVKIYPEEKGLINAVNMMCRGQDERKIHNRMYGWLKERFSKRMSEISKGKSNSQFGTIWISNLDLKISKKIFKDDKIPDGWVKGRNVWKKIEKKEKEKQKISNKKEYVDTYFRDLFQIFIDGNYSSVRDFYRQENIDYSLMTVENNWRRLCDKYKAIEGKPYSSSYARSIF